MCTLPSYSFLLSLLGSLGNLATASLLLCNILDDTDSHSLPHVTHSETTQRGILRELLDAHRLAWHHDNNGGISRLDKLGVVLKLLTTTSVNFFLQFHELAGNMGSVAIQHWGITLGNLTGVVQDDDLKPDTHSITN